MATKTVQDLALESTPAGTDHVIIDDGTTTRKATVSSVVNAGVDLSSVAENIVPDTDNVRSLGTAAKTWKDVFVGPGSLYVNGQKVLEDDAGTIVVSADANQNLDIKTTGTGDIGLTTAAGGKVEVGGTLEIAAGKNITSSDGNAISVTNGLDMNGEAITGLAAGSIDAATLSGTLDLSGKTVTLPANAVTPHASVTSVNGQTGAVTIAETDISGKVDKVTWQHAAGDVGTFNENSSIGAINVGAQSGIDGSAATTSISSGSLPTGITMSSEGVISGTMPEQLSPSTNTFEVTVTVGADSQTRTFTITNNADNDTPTWTTTAGELPVAAGAYSEQLVASDPEGSGLTYTLQSGSLPSGLTVSSSGLISGTATADGNTYNFTINVSDGSLSADRSFSILTGATSKSYYSYGASSGYTGGWHDTTVTAASTNYVSYNSNNFYLYNVGSNNTWMGVHTRLHSTGTFAIPSYHNYLKMYMYIEVKESNNNDGGGEMYVKYGSSQRGSEYGTTYIHGPIGNNDDYWTTLSSTIPESAKGQNVYITIGSSGGQHCNIRFNIYTIKSFIS